MTIKTIGRCLGQAEDGSLWFWCAGCDKPHSLRVGSGPGPRWGYNGNADSPTFTPSVLAQWDEGEPPATTPEIRDKIRSGEIVQVKVAKVCHSFVTDGRIQYLTDCTHALVGQTVDLPDWEASWNSW
ncbi:ammonia monooxygenase [Pseudomonas sp. 13159349]|uniref:DUF6527 family protein n=1 Tax=Pseudomonas sp. 13159349 TaxID=2662034 RepID=UPI00156E2710|nr:DUF6527 family protein [Pseudomonas sp. 13159349]QKK95792.1 ammonia monooxygenase [Pseudomonas sp. 13159349]